MASLTGKLPVAIIGAGPIGLAAAAQLVKRGEVPIVFETGAGPGHTVKEWRHVRMFSPWEFNTDKAAVDLLTASGWAHPAKEDIPNGQELIERYLDPLASLPSIWPRMPTDTHLFVLGILSFGAAVIGRRARRGRWHGWLRIHVVGMGVSYILLLTAFYVDNGPHLLLTSPPKTTAGQNYSKLAASTVHHTKGRDR